MLKGRHFDRSVILLYVRWYLAYGLSLRDLEEMIAEQGICVDHSTIHRWVAHYSPLLIDAFNAKKRQVGGKWHVDEPYIKVRGRWMYLYRAIDEAGATVEFLFSPTRNLSGAERIRAGSTAEPLKIRHSKYMNNRIKQDHRRIKRRIRPMMGFESPQCAGVILGGIELVHMIREGQMECASGTNASFAFQFDQLIA